MNDNVIIGAGPAGIASAIYLKRAGFDPIVLEKGEVGGLLLNANLVENYPGFPEGICGRALVGVFRKQLARLGIEVQAKEVSSISLKDGLFALDVDDDEIISRSLIVATGTKPKCLGIQGESTLLGKKLFYEIKDIPALSWEGTIAIIGAGDAAFDYALNLADDVSQVDIIMRNDRPKCLSLLWERVKESDNIQTHPKTVPIAFEEGDGIITKCTTEDKEISFSSEYTLIACGREPNLDIFPKDVVKTLIIEEDGGTNIPGLFIAGDVRRGRRRQAGIAVGDGILCAMSAMDYLKGEEP
ncbi:MAG: NAD(P)/FAD-dependent oxidoreductase [Thermoplasmata archaeon]|nr:MAG: NAD(P)/FAD-dependent oxidoreductase [Thermoplasmata archaeon]